MNLSNIRKNGMVGIIEDSNLDYKNTLHFSEWWNGEGFEISFNDDKNMSLHLSQLRMLVIMLLATDYIDIEECKEAAQALLLSSDERERIFTKMRSELKDWNE